MSKWVLCKDRLPKPETTVLVCTKRKPITLYVKPSYQIALGFYEDGNMREIDSDFHWDEMEFDNYDDENECGIITEGWYESVTYKEESGVIDDEVIAWMPLPIPYKDE